MCAYAYLCSQAAFKVFFHFRHRNSVLRPFGTAAARDHSAQIQLYHLRERERDREKDQDVLGEQVMMGRTLYKCFGLLVLIYVKFCAKLNGSFYISLLCM